MFIYTVANICNSNETRAGCDCVERSGVCFLFASVNHPWNCSFALATFHSQDFSYVFKIAFPKCMC